MTPMQTLALTLWGLSVAAFVALMVYRANLTNHETDQLFLSSDGSTDFREQEQTDIVRRVERLKPYCQGAGGAAALTTIAVVGLAVANVVHQL
ncbi:MAG: hypothetical protein PW792_12740 [Acidobacteriaceae bacterium]|nr:hypothetical protein [Acidobacteriaceae bacterium]